MVQAALAAAGCGEHRRAAELIDRAVGVAADLRGYDDLHGTSFGPVTVEMARVLLAAQRGDTDGALARHVTVVRREVWRRLPAEYQGAYLRGAALALVDADSVAPAEVRGRFWCVLASLILPVRSRHRPAWHDWRRSSASLANDGAEVGEDQLCRRGSGSSREGQSEVCPPAAIGVAECGVPSTR
ncbi:hypothetical protein [Micromonospora sp. NPDC049359]|uniref:hypothetical protein n=1 Tax=Micromonospora sp. NPDC049359 TaxID=3364270 RepID=UPI00379640C7